MLESNGELPFKTEILNLRVLYPIHLSSEDQSGKFKQVINSKFIFQTPFLKTNFQQRCQENDTWTQHPRENHINQVIVQLTYKRNEKSQDNGNALDLETVLSKINPSTNSWWPYRCGTDGMYFSTSKKNG